METALKTVVKQLVGENNKSLRWLAERIGFKNPASLNVQLGRGNITLQTFYKICEAMDYEITIQPKGKRGARPSGQIVVDLGVEE